MEQTDLGYWDAISTIKHVPNINERSLPHFIVRAQEDFIVSHEAIQSQADELKENEQLVNYIGVEGAGLAFFDWKPDATT